MQSGLIVVDFVSLLISKDRPTQAMQTLSTVLREMVGIGTLSVGRVANAAQTARALQKRHGNAISAAERQILDEANRQDASRLLERKIEATGWQLVALDRASDKLAVVSKRLRAEMRREQTYWAEILAVRQRGWALSRMPGEPNVLRVKFGFSEAAPDLQAAGFAALRRGKHGHVSLDLSVLGPPSAVVVTLRRRLDGGGGKRTETGHSLTPTRVAAAAPLEDHILEARNTVFAKELWREINREVRLMAGQGVVVRRSEIVFPAGEHTEAVITFEPLSREPSMQPHRSPELDNLAESLCTSLHLFLSCGHRERYRQRSIPRMPTNTAPQTKTYFILRPIVANLKYEKAITHMSAFLSDLCSVLHAVGESGSRFKVAERRFSSLYLPPAPQPKTADPPAAASTGTPGAKPAVAPPPITSRNGHPRAASEVLCMALLSPREFSFEFHITADVRILVRCRTTVVPLKAQYLVQLLPPPSARPPQPVAPGAAPPRPKAPLLHDLFPPADSYASLYDVMSYVRHATAHILTLKARRIARSVDGDGSGAWATAVDGMEIREVADPYHRIRISIVHASLVTELDALMAEQEGKEAGGEDGSRQPSVDLEDMHVDAADGDGDGDGDGNGKGEATATAASKFAVLDSPLARPSPPELRVYGAWAIADDDEALVYRKWAWSAESVARASGAVASFESVIQGCVSGALKPVPVAPA